MSASNGATNGAGIALPPGDYWELQARAERIRALESRLEALQQHLALARADLQFALTRVVGTHGLDAQATYRFDDTTCSVIPLPVPGPAPVAAVPPLGGSD